MHIHYTHLHTHVSIFVLQTEKKPISSKFLKNKFADLVRFTFYVCLEFCQATILRLHIFAFCLQLSFNTFLSATRQNVRSFIAETLTRIIGFLYHRQTMHSTVTLSPTGKVTLPIPTRGL